MLIDTHAHLNFNTYKDNIGEVIKRTLDNNVWVINVGSQYETSKKAIEIAEKYQEGVYAAVGLHPIHLETGLVKIKNDKEEIEVKTREEEFDYQKYKELAKSKKVVAIGETGLDYYYRPKTKKKLEEFKNKQKEVFLQHLELAQELDLPLIFHCRMAHQDLLELLMFNINSHQTIQQSNPEGKLSASYGAGIPTIRGAIHCFTGTWTQAQQYLEMGFYLGFNGIIFSSFAKSYGGSAEAPGEGGKLNLDEIIEKTPLERILIETDCPYLTPLPAVASAKAGRNEPLFVKYVAEKIAKIKKLSFEEIAEITTKNAQELFKII